MVVVEVAGYRLRGRVKDRGVKKSPYTGDELRTFTIRTSLDSERAHNEILEAVREQGNDTVLMWTDEGEDPKEFSASIPRWSSTSRRDGKLYRYTMELSEIEEYTVTTLHVAGLELDPIKFEESRTGEALSFDVVAELEEREFEEFHKLWREPGKYCDVIREDVDDEARQMRLGMCFWSDHDNSRKKAKLTLVDKKYDEIMEGGKPGLTGTVDIADGNARRDLAYYESVIDRLTDKLQEEEILTEEEVEQIREPDEEEIEKRLFQFYEVGDAENYM